MKVFSLLFMAMVVASFAACEGTEGCDTGNDEFCDQDECADAEGCVWHQDGCICENE